MRLHKMALRLAPLLASLPGSMVLSPPATAAPEWLPGVNLSGGEFNSSNSKLGFTYNYPTKAEITYFASKGMRVFRIPVLSWRVLTRSMSDDGGGKDWRIVTDLVAHAAAARSSVIIELHQFGKMPTGLIGRDAAATAEFVTAWAELARRLKDQPNVIFGLMNEPNKQSATEWLSGANAAIAAIRKAGAKQLILVPGSYWDGASNWTSTDNGKVMIGVKDPAGNYAYELHQYLDQWSVGQTADVLPGAGKTRLVAFTNWARANKVKGFLGEFGFAATPDGMREGGDLLAYMAANKDVWLGWTYWSAGPWWGKYIFSVEPDKGGGDKPQMELLTKYK